MSLLFAPISTRLTHVLVDLRYDFVLEPIDETFVMAQTQAGQGQQAPKESEAERKARTMDEVKKSLPVYP